MYGLNEQVVYRHLGRDAVMRQVIGEVHAAGPFAFPVPTLNVYRDLLEAVIYQQVSIRAAKTIFGRFCTSLGDAVDDPSALAEIDLDSLRSLGVSGRKAAYLHNIAQFFRADPSLNDALPGMTDEAVGETLIRIKGVGAWTVKMILIFSLGRPDVLPMEDLAIRQAVSECYGTSGNALEMEEIAAEWKPFRTYASHLLWRWKRIRKGIDY